MISVNHVSSTNPNMDDSVLRMETDVIHEAGRKLECNREIVEEACVIYHLFRRCVDQAEYDKNLVSAAVLYLSSTNNEQGIEMDDVINTFHSIEMKGRIADPKEMISFRHSLISMIFVVSRSIEFDMRFKLAHQYLMHFLQHILGLPYIDNHRNDITVTCTKLLTDFYMDKKCLNHQAEHIAVAVIHLSILFYAIPMSRAFGTSNLVWHKALCGNITAQKLSSAIEDILSVYEGESESI